MAEKKNSNINKGELQQFNNFVLFKTKNGKVNIDVYFQNETLWLSQKSIVELFEKGRSTITEHLKKIFEEGELEEKVVCRNFRHTTQHGAIEGFFQEKEAKFYNLKAITAVGYRVNSHRATEFRKWASNVLHEYIIKGFATVQNKLHWPIAGKTAAEIIYTEADATKIYMGLKTWKHAPNGKILKSDVSIAKNYLNQEHIKILEQIVSGYLEVAETRAKNRQIINMKDWDKFLIQFLELADYPILKDNGIVTMLEAKLKAEQNMISTG